MDECSVGFSLPAKCKDKKKSKSCKKKIKKKKNWCKKKKNLKKCKYSCHTISGETHKKCVAFDDTACDHCTFSKTRGAEGMDPYVDPEYNVTLYGPWEFNGYGRPGDILEDNTMLKCEVHPNWALDFRIGCRAKMPPTNLDYSPPAPPSSPGYFFT